MDGPAWDEDFDSLSWAHEMAEWAQRQAAQVEGPRRLALIECLRIRPGALFESALAELLPFAFPGRWPISRPRVRVHESPAPIADAETWLDRRWWPTWRIRVHRGLTALLFDLVQLALSRTRILTRQGEEATAPDISAAEAERILHRSIRDYVTDRAYEASSGLEQAWRARLERERSQPFRRWRDWPLYLEQMTRFVVAHELGHIRLGHPHPDRRGRPDPWEDEFAADAEAARILLQYTEAQAGLWSSVRKASGSMIADPHSIRAATLGAVGLLFTAFEFIGRAGRELNAAGLVAYRWGTTHPSGFERYHRFHRHCVDAGLASAPDFGMRISDVEPPNSLRRSISLHLLGLDWLVEPDRIPPEEPGGPDLPALVEAELASIRRTREHGEEDPAALRRRLEMLLRRLERSRPGDEDQERAVSRTAVLVIEELLDLCAGPLGLPDDALIHLDTLLAFESARSERLDMLRRSLVERLGYRLDSPEIEREREELLRDLQDRLNVLRHLDDQFPF